MVKPRSKIVMEVLFFLPNIFFISEQFHPLVGVWSWGQAENSIKEPNNSSRLIFCHIPCIIQLIYNINYNSQSRKLMNAINIKPFEILKSWQQHLNEENFGGSKALQHKLCADSNLFLRDSYRSRTDKRIFCSSDWSSKRGSGMSTECYFRTTSWGEYVFT